MNTQTMKGNWMQLTGKMREQWGKLTNDDLDVIAGKRDQLVGRLKELYGRSTEEIEKEVAAFEKRMSEDASHVTAGT
jgi:uncharacterized protein YjbJ (UPF0337 family)